MTNQRKTLRHTAIKTVSTHELARAHGGGLNLNGLNLNGAHLEVDLDGASPSAPKLGWATFPSD